MKKKPKPIVIKVDKVYGQYWLNVIDIGDENIVMDHLFKTKTEALIAYPTLVDKKNRKIARVWVVSAL
jgi:hypothetical protein